jgi:uncharacterized delta-60 repeat protein
MTKQATLLLNSLLLILPFHSALAQHTNGKSSGGSCLAPVPLNTPISSPTSTACSNDSTGTCLDATFGSGGLVITNTDGSLPKSNDLDGAAAVDQLTDGTSRLVAIGDTTDPQTKYQGVAVIRYNADGSLDSSFGSGGISKVFVSSNPPDSTVDGGIDSNGNTVALVYVNGNAVVARFTHAGLLDTTFNSVGYTSPISLDPHAMVIQPDAKILIAGLAYGRKTVTTEVIRLNSDGSLDTTFGTNGLSTVSALSAPFAITLQSVNSQLSILVGGQTGAGDFGIVRMNLSGMADSTFGASGLATTSLCGFGGRIDTLAVDSVKNILVGGVARATSGGSQKIALARFTPNGVLDTTFGNATGSTRTGITLLDFFGSNNSATSLQPLPDGSGGFMVGGQADRSVGTTVLHYMIIAKYDATGSLVPAFGSNGAVAVDFGGGDNFTIHPGSSNLLIQSDGKPMIATSAAFASGTYTGYNFALARFWP